MRSEKSAKAAAPVASRLKQKAGANERRRGEGRAKGQGKGRETRQGGDGRSWSKDWDDRGMAGSDTYAAWEGSAKKRRLVSEAQGPERWTKVQTVSQFGYGGRGGSQWGGGGQREMQRAERMNRQDLDRSGHDDRGAPGGIREDRGSAGGMRGFGGVADRGVFGNPRGRDRAPVREERPSARERPVLKSSGRSGDGSGNKIRVSNVPKSLDEQEIREAFEDVGVVSKCSLDRGVAIIAFNNSSAAKKAVATFDRGELNGQTIYVAFEP